MKTEPKQIERHQNRTDVELSINDDDDDDVPLPVTHAQFLQAKYPSQLINNLALLGVPVFSRCIFIKLLCNMYDIKPQNLFNGDQSKTTRSRWTLGCVV